MNFDQFWQLIEQSKAAATKSESRLACLEKALLALPPREIVSFEGNCWDQLSLSYKREIWAVATIIQPSCTQASFDGVRAWIVLEGKDFFDRVAAKPEVLSERAPRGSVPWIPEGEMLLRMASRIYQKLMGDDLPTLPRKVPYVLKGSRWTEFDLPEMFPSLWQKYRL